MTHSCAKSIYFDRCTMCGRCPECCPGHKRPDNYYGMTRQQGLDWKKQERQKPARIN